MRTLKKLIVAIVPASALRVILSVYHFILSFLGAFLYGFPARKLLVVGVTGTKGKSSTTEMLSALFEEAGRKTAVLNSIRVKIGAKSEPNLMRMTMPGRFFIQKFLYDAAGAGCAVAIIEMTSEGARQHRHRFIDLDALVFTNLAPEHIESHGSYEAYADAKFEIGRELARSSKRPRIMVASAESKESPRYLALPVEHKLPFSLSSCQPWSADENGGHFHFDGLDIHINFPGEFSLKNALGSATVARTLGVQTQVIAKALEKMKSIPGRAERVEAGQNVAVVVDYAQTPDSLEALYNAYSSSTSLVVTRRLICVLGATGGGRDTWKRPVMGAIAAQYCAEVILTNEDPYDENPRVIVNAVAQGMKRKPEVIMDRREAIRSAFARASAGDAVLITGKGTDPCICAANGEQIPWSDAAVAREELASLLSTGNGV